MKRLLLIIAVMATIASSAQAQGEVSGKVTDARDGSAIQGATVRVKGTNTGTSTNAAG